MANITDGVDIARRLDKLTAEAKQLAQDVKLDKQQTELTELDQRLAEPEIWNNLEQAQALTRQAAALRQELQPWQALMAQLADAKDMLDIIDGDIDLTAEFNRQLDAMEDSIKKLGRARLFTGKYDSHGAILRLSSGAGGADAQDFTAMLERMYLRYIEAKGWHGEIIERSAGAEAGIKSVAIEINGRNAYGWLRGEHGVHRLVRLSPFNAESRETSFALVEVLPKIEQTDQVQINQNDLRIDVYRSSGNGGQGVNTTDSAVRITHIPTGITVAIQNERSQIQNKARAMDILIAKLTALQIEQQASSLDELRATESASFGAQIRNYILHPYKLVKDTRTKHQESDVERVLDGNLDDFALSYLKWSADNKR